ncbi:hypothetical protein BC835DRAFT_322226 [Cytidiella melzeri]|nr:hypothetical protein BC835DRAFT_322226 [Cytidiella melzeri]
MPPPADAPSQPRSTSPRKRRAAATGAAGGAGGKRRRKEVDDGDGTYPNPVNRRTRNPRGAAAAFASPLAGPAVVAEANAEDIEAEADADQATTAAGEPVEATTRSTRSRRSRAAVPKRRESSASETTSTSVSVSIAANTRNTRSVGAKRSSEDDLPVDTVDAGRQSPAQDAEEKTEAAAAVQSPAGAGDALSHGGDGLLEKNAPTATIPPATADVPMEMDDVTDTTAEPTTSKLASDKGARMPDEHSSDDPRVRTTRSKPASTRPSPLRLTSVEDEDTAQAHPAQSLSMMDVDTPHKIAPVPSAHDDYQAQADVQSPKLKSPSPHIPASAPVPPVTSASIPETSRTVPVTQPPPTKLKADDEKEEGELSDV